MYIKLDQKKSYTIDNTQQEPPCSFPHYKLFLRSLDRIISVTKRKENDKYKKLLKYILDASLIMQIKSLIM